MSEYVLGIDLGTSTTTVSIVKDGMATVIPIEGEEDGKIMPSVVSFLNEGKNILVGKKAKDRRHLNPINTIYSIKRIIGRKYSHPETIKYAKKFPYKVVGGKNDSVEIEIFGKRVTPQMISSLVLRKAKKAATDYLGFEVNDAVITVPANYNEAQRRATQDAGKMAGLNVLRIINEPTAAALAYGFGNNLDEKIAVFDFGGGTFDITVLEVKDNFFEVLSTAGDSFLGGDDIDAALVQFMVVDIEANYNIRMEMNNEMLTILLAEAERIKISLSTEEKIRVLIKNMIPLGENRYADYERIIDRKLFQEIISPIIQRTFDITATAIENAHVEKGQIDAVILVGGSTKIPYVQDKVTEFFGQPPYFGIESVLVISMGASILGHTLISGYSEAAPVLLDVIPLSIGVGTIGDYIEIIIEKNEPLPIERTSVFTNATDEQTAVRIEIFQGDARNKSESHLMGNLVLSDLRKAKRGELKVEVKFEVDTNGVLNISAVDLETGKIQKISLNILGLE
ncbi:MAG TPA: Hsp70 family protein [bacterium]|nr:Hsp70 family protein [bacterium]